MEKIDEKNLKHICYNIPKAELHIHIEGTLEPELVIELAKKHNISQFNDLEELKTKYKFTCLKDFLDLYYNCCDVLRDESDFSDLMYYYFKRASSQGLKYAEIFFDPQTHLNRGIKFNVFINGLLKGLEKSEKEFNVKGQLIMCFLRDHSEEDALEVFKTALDFLKTKDYVNSYRKRQILGIGLDSNEINNPPEKFRNVYRLAKQNGFRLVAHAGEECCIPVDYIYAALDTLYVERIDHGVQVTKCDKLLSRVINEKIPLTLCPLSNVKLKVHKDVSESPLKIFMDKGVRVMLNSDDPAYFGGYIGDNYYEVTKAFNLNLDNLAVLATNSFLSTFLEEEEKSKYIEEVIEFARRYK